MIKLAACIESHDLILLGLYEERMRFFYELYSIPQGLCIMEKYLKNAGRNI